MFNIYTDLSEMTQPHEFGYDAAPSSADPGHEYD